MELDFKGCETKEDIARVFEEKRKELQIEFAWLRKLKRVVLG